MNKLAIIDQSIQTMDQWIQVNKPAPLVANSLAQQFMVTAKMEGDPVFLDIIRNLIDQTSKLAIGSQVLKNLLDSGKPIHIVQTDINYYDTDKDIIGYCFGKKESYGAFYDSNRGLELHKVKEISLFIHELLHKMHDNIDPKNQRHEKPSLWPEMHNEEEEFTISGNLHRLDEQILQDQCCEWTVSRELGIPFRTHLGFSLLPNERPNLCDMISIFSISSIKKELSNVPIASLLQLKDRKTKETPLEMALHYSIEQSDPELQAISEEILFLLIKAGFSSEYAMRLFILMGREDLIRASHQINPVFPENAFDLALESHPYLTLTIRDQNNTFPHFREKEYDLGEMIPQEIIQKLWVAKQKRYNLLNSKFPIRQESEKEKLISLLLELGARPSEKTFQSLLRSPARNMALKKFCEFKVEIPPKILLNMISHSHLEAIRILIENGNMEPTGKHLVHAVAVGNPDVTKYLYGLVAPSNPDFTPFINRKWFKDELDFENHLKNQLNSNSH